MDSDAFGDLNAALGQSFTNFFGAPFDGNGQVAQVVDLNAFNNGFTPTLQQQQLQQLYPHQHQQNVVAHVQPVQTIPSPNAPQIHFVNQPFQPVVQSTYSIAAGSFHQGVQPFEPYQQSQQSIQQQPSQQMHQFQVPPHMQLPPTTQPQQQIVHINLQPPSSQGVITLDQVSGNVSTPSTTSSVPRILVGKGSGRNSNNPQQVAVSNLKQSAQATATIHHHPSGTLSPAPPVGQPVLITPTASSKQPSDLTPSSSSSMPATKLIQLLLASKSTATISGGVGKQVGALPNSDANVVSITNANINAGAAPEPSTRYSFCSICNEMFDDDVLRQVHERKAHARNSSGGESEGEKTGCASGIVLVKAESVTIASSASDSPSTGPKRKLALKSTGGGGAKKARLRIAPTLTCPKCPKTFASESTLRTHTQTQHREAVEKSAPKSCVYCGKSDFGSKQQLFDHLKSVHRVTVSCEKEEGEIELDNIVHGSQTYNCPALDCDKKYIDLVKSSFIDHMENMHFLKPTGGWMNKADVRSPVGFQCVACSGYWPWTFAQKHLQSTLHHANVTRATKSKTGDDRSLETDDYQAMAFEEKDDDVVLYDDDDGARDLLSAPKIHCCPACPPPTKFNSGYDLKVHIIKNHRGFFPLRVIQTFAPGLVKLAKSYGYNVTVVDDPDLLKKPRVKNGVEGNSSSETVAPSIAQKPGPKSSKMTGANSSNKLGNTFVKPGPLSKKVTLAAPKSSPGSGSSLVKPEKPGPLSSKSALDNTLSDIVVPFNSPRGLPYSPVGLAHKCTWKCNVCGDVVSHRNNAKRHSISRHDGVPDFTMFVNGGVVTSNQSKYKCQTCFEMFDGYAEWKSHDKLTHGGTSGVSVVNTSPETSSKDHPPPSAPKFVPGFSPTVGSGFEKKGGFQCSVCPDRDFDSEYALHCHRIKAHPSKLLVETGPKGEAKCDECDVKFSTYSNLRRHLKIRHGMGEKKYVCSACKKEFATLSNGRRHLSTHPSLASLTIVRINSVGGDDDETDGVFMEPEDADVDKDEELKKSLIPEFRCEKCNLGFPYESMLLLHYKRKHPELLDGGKIKSGIAKNGSSPKKSKSITSPKNGTKVSPKISPNNTHICPPAKTNPDAVKAAPKKHAISDLTLLHKFGLGQTLHVRVTRLNTVNCPKCNQNFLNENAMAQHLRSHNCVKSSSSGHGDDSSKSLPCKSCEQMFTNPRVLKRHQNLIHTRSDVTKFFSCPICNEGFDTRAELSSHLTKEYAVVVTKWLTHSPNKGAGYKCKTCQEQFPYSTIAQHVLSHDYRNEGNFADGDEADDNDDGDVDSREYYEEEDPVSIDYDEEWKDSGNEAQEDQFEDVRVDTVDTSCVVCGKSKTYPCYGKYVCHPCRMFFFTVHKDKKASSLACKKDQDCDLTERGACSYCRWQKCLRCKLDIKKSEAMTRDSWKSEGAKKRKPSPKKRANNAAIVGESEIVQCGVCSSDAEDIYGDVPCCSLCLQFYRRYRDNPTSLKCLKSSRLCDVSRPYYADEGCKRCRMEKCLKAGMGKKDGISESRLKSSTDSKPSRCAVCSNPASVRYFGVHCCNACKEFFYKNHKDGLAKLVCNENESCDLLDAGYNSRHCRLCRLNKCFQVGLGEVKNRAQNVQGSGYDESAVSEVASSHEMKDDEDDKCVVCWRPAEGTFYGVRSCQRCKRTFAKYARENPNFVCKNDASCNLMDPKLPISCQYCVAKECVRRGMTRSGADFRDEEDTKTNQEERVEIDFPIVENSDVCKICNGEAHGVRYGVVACNSCRQFFGSYYDQLTNFECEKGKSCGKLSMIQLKNCRYCRLKKCIDAGMSKFARAKIDEPKPSSRPVRKYEITMQKPERETRTPDKNQPDADENNDEDRICRVCRGEAQGNGYGVPACHPCRVFFGKSHDQIQNFRCESRKACDKKNMIQLRRCQYCRLKKCLKVGMTKLNSKEDDRGDVPVKSEKKAVATSSKGRNQKFSLDSKSRLCKICGQAAIYKSYGVWCCNPCRMFFCAAHDQINKFHCKFRKACLRSNALVRRCRYCRLKKCLRSGMSKLNEPDGSTKSSRSSKSPPPLEITIIKSPPTISKDGISKCAVCGRDADGIHYGVSTCHRCKDSFRKTIFDPRGMSCKEDSSCGLRTPPFCKLCHTKKCLSLGMTSKNWQIPTQEILSACRSYRPFHTKVKDDNKNTEKTKKKANAGADDPLLELQTQIRSVRRISSHCAGYGFSKSAEFRKCLTLFKEFGRVMAGRSLSLGKIKARESFEKDLDDFVERFKNLTVLLNRPTMIGGVRWKMGAYLKEQATKLFIAERKKKSVNFGSHSRSVSKSPSFTIEDQDSALTEAGAVAEFSPTVVAVGSVKIEPAEPIKRETGPSRFESTLSVVNALIDAVVVDGDMQIYEQCAHLRESKLNANNGLRCTHCDEKGFATSAQLDHHRKLLHGDKSRLRRGSSAEFPVSSLAEIKDDVKPNLAEVEEEAFRCDKCHQRYVSAESLRQHVVRYHPSKATKSAFSCPFCRKMYHAKTFLESHMEVAHGGKRSVDRAKYTCHCDSYYYSKKDFEEHLRFGHGVGAAKYTRGKMPFSVKCFSCNQHYKWEALSRHLETDIHRFFSTYYFDREPRIALERIIDVDAFVGEYDRRVEDCRRALTALVDAVADDTDYRPCQISECDESSFVDDEERHCVAEFGLDEFGDDYSLDADSTMDNFDSDMHCEVEEEEEAAEGDVSNVSIHKIAPASGGCNRVAKKRTSSVGNKRKLSSGGRYRCDKCGTYFANASNLYRHRRKGGRDGVCA